MHEKAKIKKAGKMNLRAKADLYFVVEASTSRALAIHVNAAIANGYAPTGGVTASTALGDQKLYQAMVKADNTTGNPMATVGEVITPPTTR